MKKNNPHYFYKLISIPLFLKSVYCLFFNCYTAMCFFCHISLILSFTQTITSDHKDALVVLSAFLAFLKLP